MNDTAFSTATGPRGGLQGLPYRLVSDGLVEENAMVDALAASRERRQHIVTYLVEYNLADSREIAIAASQEFGAPLLDLDAIQPDLEIIRLVSEKTIRKHRVLPLVKRGKRLFVAISDPTNLTSITVPYGKLTTSNLYWWRVRYQDNHGAWSNWSEEMHFDTTPVPNQVPDLPSNTAPTAGDTGVSLTPTLSASAFSDPDDGDTHAASQWQIDDDPWDFTSPAFDSGTDNTFHARASAPIYTLTLHAAFPISTCARYSVRPL